MRLPTPSPRPPSASPSGLRCGAARRMFTLLTPSLPPSSHGCRRSQRHQGQAKMALVHSRALSSASRLYSTSSRGSGRHTTKNEHGGQCVPPASTPATHTSRNTYLLVRPHSPHHFIRISTRIKHRYHSSISVLALSSKSSQSLLRNPVVVFKPSVRPDQRLGLRGWFPPNRQ